MQILRLFIVMAMLAFCILPETAFAKSVKTEKAAEEVAEPVNVAVWLSLRMCESDADCTVVETSCGSCCNYSGIRKDAIKKFKKKSYRVQCESYDGPECDCKSPEMTAVCSNGLCTAK